MIKSLHFLNNSKGFIISAERSANRIRNEDGTIESPLIPAIVNLAFSIEISLKGIIFIDKNDFVSGHGIEILFQKLNINHKESIYFSLMKTGKFHSKEEIEVYIKSINNSFVDWRYIHEKIINNEILTMDYAKLHALAIVLHDFLDTKIKSKPTA